jgi:hypothetical protein
VGGGCDWEAVPSRSFEYLAHAVLGRSASAVLLTRHADAAPRTSSSWMGVSCTGTSSVILFRPINRNCVSIRPSFITKNFLQEKAVEATKQEKERKEEKT